MRRITILTLLLSLLSSQIFASDLEKKKEKEETKKNDGPVAGKLYASPIPVIASNPAFGLIYGVATSGAMFMGDPETTRMSSALLTATYSTKNQLMFTFKPTIYTANDKWNFIGDYRVFFSSQNTYGLGSDKAVTPIDQSLGEQPMEFDMIRLYQTGLKQIKPNFYAGVGYHLDMISNINDMTLNVEEGVITDHYKYSTEKGFDPEEYNLSGVSANVLYDSRDNVANPYTGRYAYASFKYNPTWLGSTKNSSTLWLEYRDYFSVSKNNERNIIAIWTYGNFVTSGDVPYMLLPALGWDQMGRSGRAFPQGRFRGENLMYLEAEYRFGLPIVKSNPDLLGGVIFANATTASSEMDQVNMFDELQVAVGAGLRIQINKKTRTNLSLDYGISMKGEGAFYLGLTEYF